MDYILLSTLLGVSLAMLVVSYDVACQWSVNFSSRFAAFPAAMQFDIINILFDTVIPKFHILGHGPKCQSIFSLNYRRWMGRTDGEGVEREWSHINPVALSTKVMGPGSRHDTLDDHWGAWNWRKVVLMGLSFTIAFALPPFAHPFYVLTGRHLRSKLSEAVPASRKHRALLNALSATFPPQTVSEWTKMVEDWQEDVTAPNPFEETALGTARFLFTLYDVTYSYHRNNTS
jgi:hypothetical protein